MPGVVHADQDAEHGGIQIQGVALPAGVEVDDPVAADAPVVDVQLLVEVVGQQTGRDQPGIAAAESAVGLVGFTAAAAVGYGIPLEYDDFFRHFSTLS